MCKTMVTKLVLLCVFVASVSCNTGEYYWRPWTSGSPPPDAFTVRDYRGVSYIVEAYIPNYGLYVGQVFANQHEVNVTVPTTAAGTTFVIQTGNYLKVLCTQSVDKLAWYPTYYTTFPNDLVTGVVKPVLGGINVHDQIVYIGRYVDTATVRPVVVAGIHKDNRIHYDVSGKLYSQYYYEILVISKRCTSD